MLNVVVCDGDEEERNQLLKDVRDCCRERRWDVSAEGFANWTELFKRLKTDEPDIIVIAQNGVEGLDTITSSHLPPGKVIWFSDLDFGIQAYRMCLSWFGKKPVSCHMMEQALLKCMEAKATDWNNYNVWEQEG